MPRAEERLAPSSGSIWGGQTRACGGDGVTVYSGAEIDDWNLEILFLGAESDLCHLK